MATRPASDIPGSYPTICELLGSAFRNAVTAGVSKPTAKFAQILELLNGNERSGQEVENHLTLIVAEVGIDKSRQAYASKLSSASTLTALEDYCFEIEVAARASQILDKGSVVLEHPIPRNEDDPPGENNSDVFGTFKGERIRIDATVFRGQQSEPFGLDNENIVRQADISSGFDLTMAKPLRTIDHAESAKRLLELLHQHHLATGGSDFQKDGFTFSWESPYYRSSGGPFTNVIFHTEKDGLNRDQIRDIHHAVSVRSLAPRYIQEEIYPKENQEMTAPRAPGPGPISVFTPDKIRDPVSKTIRDRLEEKLRQCEQGTISLIAVKTRYPHHQSDLKDALFGATYGVVVTPLVDADGRPLPDKKEFLHADQAPFSRIGRQAQEGRQEYSDPFKVMSGVWLFPAYREDPPETLLNPHATTPVSDRLAESLHTGGGGGLT
jgi:hypothetical protein